MAFVPVVLSLVGPLNLDDEDEDDDDGKGRERGLKGGLHKHGSGRSSRRNSSAANSVSCAHAGAQTHAGCAPGGDPAEEEFHTPTKPGEPPQQLGGWLRAAPLF